MASGAINRITGSTLLLLCLMGTKAAQLSTTTNNLATNINVQLGVGLSENISGIYCNVSTTFQIPSYCLDVILTNSHFQYTFGSEVIRINIGSYDIGNFKNYQFANPNNDTIHLCFPLTPQLLNCNLRRFGPGCYELNHYNLTIPGRQFSTELGDYYLDSEKNAFVCAESIIPDKHRARCNNVQLAFGQYVIYADGSVYINATNTTIKHPQYQVAEADNKLSVCYPLSIPFLNCFTKSAMLLHNYLYDRRPELKIYFRSYRRMYSVDEYYSKNNNYADFIVCAPENPQEAIILRYLYNTFKCASCILITFTISHHLMAPKLTVHAKCLLSYYISGIAYFIVTLIPVMECYTFFVTIYLTSNAAVIWVNIASYDIWKSFTRLRKSPNQYPAKKKSDPYAHYCILGWGAPIVLCILSLILDKIYSMRNVLFLSAQVGLNSNCFYHEKWIAFGLHYGFILILSLVNAVFFILTIYSIHKESKGTEILNKRRKTQMYLVRFKLFFIMGCVLVMEGITWCIQEQFNFQFWFIADAFISVQGLAIFFVETCKREAFRLISNRFRQNFEKLAKKWNLSSVRSTVHTETSSGSASASTSNGQFNNI